MHFLSFLARKSALFSIVRGSSVGCRSEHVSIVLPSVRCVMVRVFISKFCLFVANFGVTSAACYDERWEPGNYRFLFRFGIRVLGESS